MGTTHEVEGLGIICKECIEKARECRKEGCEGIGTESMDGLCRAHYMGDFDELHIDDFGGHWPGLRRRRQGGSRARPRSPRISPSR
jgi:hypothetical protein